MTVVQPLLEFLETARHLVELFEACKILMPALVRLQPEHVRPAGALLLRPADGLSHARDVLPGGACAQLLGFTFFFGTLKEVWVSGDWGEMISFKVFFSLALFVFSFFIPMIVKRVKGEI